MPMNSSGAASTRLATVAFLLLITTSVGCSPRSKVLAKVGSQTITVDQFMNVAGRMQIQYPGSPDSARRLLYNDLLRRALLLEEAKHGGLIPDSLIRNYQRGVENELLKAAVLERMIPRDVPVSAAEVRDLYARRDSATQIQIIFALDRNIADAAMAALRRGESFGEVADRVNLAGQLPPGGMLDYLVPGSLVNPLDEILDQGRLGQVVGPLQAPGEGWFIVRVVARKARAKESFEEIQQPLMQALQQRKRRMLSVRAFQALREEYHVTLEPTATRFLFDYFSRGGDTPPSPGPGERARVLARYDGGDGYRGVYTFGEALQDLETEPRERPNPNFLPSFDQWLESKLVQRVAVVEARRRHLHEEPEIAANIEERVNNYILDAVYEMEVLRRATPGVEDLRTAYERRAATLERLENATVQWMVLPDSGAAARVIELAQRAPTLREAIILSSAGLTVQQEVLSYPNADPIWGPLEPVFRVMTPPAYGEPVRTPRGWMVYQLLSKHQSRPTLEALSPDLLQALQSEAIESARERRLIQLTDSLKKATPIEEHLDRLKQIPWPVTSGGGPTGLTG